MDVVLAMPAFMPSPALPERLRSLRAEMDVPVVVVDDGSGAKFRTIFDEVAAMPNCTVLRHEANRGKGAALKTAFAFIARGFPKCAGVVAVDSDGQHAPEDCRRLAQALVSETHALQLGTRDLSLKNTPFRSWWGNRWTSLLFGLLFRRWIPDTQTGLRAIRRADIPFFLSVPGDGYEYEMAALARAVGAGMAVGMTPVRTIYEHGNESSHFHPLRDTLRIHGVLLSTFFAMKKKNLIVGFVLAAIAIAILAAMLRHADKPGDAPPPSEQPKTVHAPSDRPSDKPSARPRRNPPRPSATDAGGRVKTAPSAGKSGTSDEEAPLTEKERLDREEEKLVEAFDALTDRWLKPAPDEKGVTMEDVKHFSEQFRKVPKGRRNECLNRALNLLPDENVMLLAGIVMDKTLDTETLNTVYNDILNRDEDVKKPILQQIFKDKDHPCWANTAWILDVTGSLPKKK